MKKRALKIFVLVSIFLLVIPLFSAIPKSYAIEVGEMLTEPEDGWQRIDDTDSHFDFTGNWSTRPPQLGPTYNGSYRYTSDKSAQLKFRFYGTKIRYIGQTYSNKPKVVRINIDGSEETFRQQGENTHQIVNYEKKDLEKGYHDVVVTFDDGELMFDAIDIDADGYLVDANDPTPEPEPEPTPEPEPEPAPSEERAILVITMTTGSEKEFDLPMEDVNSFTEWYDNKEAGNGKSRYGIDKYDNNKGPFNTRTDYVIFDNILSFEINTY